MVPTTQVLSSLHKHTTVREKISSARLPLLLSWRHSLTAAGSRADLCPQVVLREARLISLLTVGAEVQEEKGGAPGRIGRQGGHVPGQRLRVQATRRPLGRSMARDAVAGWSWGCEPERQPQSMRGVRSLHCSRLQLPDRGAEEVGGLQWRGGAQTRGGPGSGPILAPLPPGLLARCPLLVVPTHPIYAHGHNK